MGSRCGVPVVQSSPGLPGSGERPRVSCTSAQLKEASELIAEALRLTMEAGEGWYEAELHRLNGLISYTHSRADEAEESFQMSVQVSRQQSARLWELRAAMSLARLWRGQGKQPAAEEVLASVYEWFTEGFDTPDLKRAESLLKDLRAQP